MGRPSKYDLIEKIKEEAYKDTEGKVFFDSEDEENPLLKRSYQELQQMLKDIQSSDIEMDIGKAELEDDVKEIPQQEPDRQMSVGDEGWTDYVLGHLREDEKREGHPKVDGLRRLVEKFIGPILENETIIAQAPSSHNNMVATVVCKILIQGDDCRDYLYCGTADATLNNCKPPFDRHLSAVAETRAEGRAFRKLLRLQSVITAEELDKGDSNLQLINDTQIQFIDRLCDPLKLDVNVEKLVKEFDDKCKSIKSLSYQTAIDINEKLNEFQHDKSLIPEPLKGYDSSWKDTFR